MSDMSNYPNGLTVFGTPVIPGLPGRGNRIWWDPINGSDSYDGRTPFSAKKTLAAAFALMVADQNDTLYALGAVASNTGDDLSAAIDWNKNACHLIGVCAPTEISPRAKVFQAAAATGLSPLFTISASGCMFENFMFFQGVNNAASLICTKITGGRNTFRGVHFAGGGHATQAIDGGASLLLDGAEECLFERCTIGLDTVDAGDGMAGILFDSEAHRITFRDTVIRLRAGHAGARWVEIVDNTGIDRDIRFIKCDFLNNSATNLTSGFSIPAGMGAPRKIFMRDCVGYGGAKWDADDRGVLFGNMNAIAGADGSGVMVQMIS
jgi:hypothetical protein